ncbi:MAG TPA: DNA phosphorothioation-associated methyltransferase, partial [Phormidium sp.]
MNYDPITNTILKSDSLENKGEKLTPLMDFAQKVLLYENEAISEQDSVNAVPSPTDEIKDFCVDNLVGKVARCCRESKVGKKLPTAFYVHVSALQALNPVLGIYENCARRTLENIDEATLVKFSLHQPKISYLF